MSPPQDTLETALDKLEDVVQEGEQYRALCPVHQGHALIVTQSKAGALLFHCKAGCDQNELITALRELGVRIASPRIRYTYHDSSGRPIFAKVRTRAADGRRITFWECYGRNGVPTVHNSKKRGTAGPGGTCKRCGNARPRGILYNLPAVQAAIADGDEIWLVEGEKDADALKTLGVTATSSMNGVDDWGPAYAEALDGARAIVIVADNDPSGVGKRGAYNRYLSLTDHANEVVVRIAANGLKDSAEHLAEGFGLSDFVPLDPDELAELSGPVSNGGKHYTDPLPGEALTELGMAYRFVERYREVARYVPIWSRWLWWNGKRWSPDENLRMQEYAKDLAREVAAVYEDVAARADSEQAREAKALARQARAFEGSGHVRGFLWLAASDRDIAFRPKDFDADPFLLNVANGVYHLRTGELTEHDPALRLTMVANGAYDPNATGTEFHRFLEAIEPNPQRRNYLQRLLGCMLEGRVTEQVLAIFHGAGANGKSTLTDAVSFALGNYATEIDPRVLRGGDRHPTEIAALAGRRIVFVEELGKLNEARVKLLTSQTPLQARRMREDPWTFVPTHNVVSNANEEPQIHGADEGIWRRALRYHFGVQIPDIEQDRELSMKLHAEADAVLTWLIDGYHSYRKRGLKPPQSVRTERSEFRKASDPVHAWIEECCERGKSRAHQETADALYKAFDAWRKERKLSFMSQNAFGRSMSAKGFDRGRISRGNTWKGLRFITNDPA